MDKRDIIFVGVFLTFLVLCNVLLVAHMFDYIALNADDIDQLYSMPQHSHVRTIKRNCGLGAVSRFLFPRHCL